MLALKTTLRVRVHAAVLLLAALASLLVAAAPPSSAADGVVLRSFTADVPPCAVSTGIAFDGSKLYLSCWDSTNLYVVSPQDGSRLGTISVSGVSGLGALAWDGSRSKMWACDSRTQAVVLISITGATATAEQRFVPPDGCIDGLAYDGGDDSLFTSGDVRPTVYHWSSDGGLLDTRAVGSSLGGVCAGNSGIAVGGGDLFLANNGCSQIYRAANVQNALPKLFATYARRIEDLECDDVTFADQGKAAIWAQDAYDAQIQALELNVGDCGFGGLPTDDEFVYVALGDSYQSGEGAGNSIADSAQYRTQAYESGTNYPAQTGAQQDTYTARLTGGNSCHRALENYAKLNRDRLQPGAETVLVDVTCSGAEIEPGGKPAIVGPVGGQIAEGSQVEQALERLASKGLGPEDVDLVTVGMGGNDAGFGKIVMTCLLPGMLEKVLQEYPDAPGELSAGLAAVGSCANAARLTGGAADAIAALPAKEVWAQRQLLSTFSTARVLQLNYPDILPTGDDPPAWCGGIRSRDVDYARDQISAIDDAVSSSIDEVGDDRLELVDIEQAFGPAALCAGQADLQLANGVSEENVDKEVRRLLNLDGNGDAVARARLDRLAEEYRGWRACLGNTLNPFDGGCDLDAEWQDVLDEYNGITAYLAEEQDTLIANVMQPPGEGTESPELLFDRSRGLFHPNARGFRVMACHVRAQYLDGASAGCLEQPNLQPDRVNGGTFDWWSPIPWLSSPGDLLDIVIGGYEPGTRIRITYRSEPVDLGVVVAEADGFVRTKVQVPAASSGGVHRLQLDGVGANGAQVSKEVRLQLPGAPVPGEDFGVYLCCFTPSVGGDGVTETVDVEYLGMRFQAHPDPGGGLFLEVPFPGAGAPDATVRAVSRLTGKTVVKPVAAAQTMSVSGFRAPWSALPAVNTAQAGSALPVTFRVVDDAGVPVTDASVLTLRAAGLDCATKKPSGASAMASAGRSGLRHLGDGWWQFDWKTERSWAGSCRAFSVEPSGGGGASLWFALR